MAHARTHLHIHDAEVAVRHDRGTIWLDIPAPRCEGDSGVVTAYLTVATLRQLRDDINAVLDNLENPPP